MTEIDIWREAVGVKGDIELVGKRGEQSFGAVLESCIGGATLLDDAKNAKLRRRLRAVAHLGDIQAEGKSICSVARVVQEALLEHEVLAERGHTVLNAKPKILQLLHNPLVALWTLPVDEATRLTLGDLEELSLACGAEIPLAP